MCLLIVYPMTDIVIGTIVGLVCIGSIVTPTFNPLLVFPQHAPGMILNLKFDIHYRGLLVSHCLYGMV